MGDPKITFNAEHLTLNVGDLGPGWSLGQLGQFQLLDHASLTFPSDWSHIKIGAATEILKYSWNLHGQLAIDAAVSTGLKYSTAAGVSGTFDAQTELHLYVLHTQAANINFSATAALNGEITSSGANVTPVWGVKFSLTLP
jgi:hypothetical protein